MSYGEGYVLVTFEAIGQAATDCNTTNAAMQQELTALKSYLAPMVQAWAGRARENYMVLQQQWDTAADDLSQVLTQISHALTVSQQNYTETETANASIWQT
jgi:6 kDa early secretory antigenic target